MGCVVAERCATILNWRVLLVDKRQHLAGNCYDEIHSSGVLIHKYGPHYFRTNNKRLLDYLSQFTDWIPGNYFVKSFVNGELYPFPINLITLSKFFNAKYDAASAEKKLEEERVKIDEPKNSEEFVLSRVGKKLYEAFYLGYTLKQWDIHPRQLDKSVCGRIPIRLNDDCRYVDHEYQLTPKDGFTKMFAKMLQNENIDVQLGLDFKEIRNNDFGQKAIVYSGPIDEYFNYQFGKLPWRSLQFDFVEYKQPLKQACVQINYPNDFDFTRSVEIKHITKQEIDNTVISFEYPSATGDPYYPIPAKENAELYTRYKALADNETEKKNVYFCGRLATYRYINTDEVIEMALETFDKIRVKHA